MSRSEYEEKFSQMKQQRLYHQLNPDQQDSLREIAFQYRLTVQEFYQVVKACRDLEMWDEGSFTSHWSRWSEEADNKDDVLSRMREKMARLRNTPTDYSLPLDPPVQPAKQGVETRQGEKEIFGDCPVASEQTVCCNLKTIDMVENCPLGCSYCSIQTFYHDRFVFDEHFSEKLDRIDLDPDRRYHICTGQSSDSLVWGNRNGVLDDLCEFALSHPNATVEFKTKTNNIEYLLSQEIPSNILCSWSLNPPVVVENEEHFTAALEERLNAARAVASRGIKVGFHIHPMIYYEEWKSDYTDLAWKIMDRFDPEELSYISLGSLTLIKPAIKKIREQGFPTKILQMPMDRDPHGKITYPDDLKVKMFRELYDTFAPWQGLVFFYLCMEKSSIWKRVLGYHYSANDEFEEAMMEHLPVGKADQTLQVN